MLKKNPDPGILSGIEDDRVKVMPASMGILENGIVYVPEADFGELFSIVRIVNDGECAFVEQEFTGWMGKNGLKSNKNRMLFLDFL